MADSLLGYKNAVILGGILMAIGEFCILGGTEMWLYIGMGTIIVGSLIGLMIKQVFPESISTITEQAVALGILIIGIQNLYE